MSATYIELHASSAFSFLEGASLPEELIAACAEYSMPAIALLDRDGVYGAPRFHLAARKPAYKHILAPKSLRQQAFAIRCSPKPGKVTKIFAGS